MSADHHPNEATPQTETASRLPVTPTAGHSARVVSIAFSPDGRLLATGSRDTSMRLWDAQSGELLSGPMVGDVVRGAHVFDVTFSPDSKVVATAVRDGTVCLWDTENHTAIGSPLTGHSSWVHDVSFHPNGKWIASASKDHTVRVWDVSVLLQKQDPSSVAEIGANSYLMQLVEFGFFHAIKKIDCKRLYKIKEEIKISYNFWLSIFCMKN